MFAAVIAAATALVGQEGFLGVRAAPGSSPLNGARGVQIVDVLPGTAAHAVGIVPGDVVVSIDDGAMLTLITDPLMFRNKIAGAGAGRTITLEVHTPYGPWQVYATLGGEMVVTTLAPGAKAPVGAGPGAKKKAPTSMKGKQVRPGSGGPVGAPTKSKSGAPGLSAPPPPTPSGSRPRPDGSGS
jgi:hypothetical protein